MIELSHHLLPLLPELALFASALLLLLLGLYGGANAWRTVLWVSPLAFASVLFLVLQVDVSKPLILMNGMLRLDAFVQFGQALVLIGAVLVMVPVASWITHEGEKRFEFPIVMMLSVIGMLLLTAANSLLAVYLGLELMSLALYVLAAFRRDSLRATEAGIKYFVLGSLASGILLFGMSLVYGFTGTLNFARLTQWVANLGMVEDGHFSPPQLGVLVGLLMVIIGFCFKISAVPFHMWTPDVYEGVPTPVTAFFAVAPKIAALVLFSRLLMQPFGEWVMQWQQVIICISMASMVLGAVAGLVQKSIKRLLAYSSIGHVGYVLMAVAAGTVEGMQAVLVYLSIYLVMSVGVFACILLMQRDGQYIEEIDALSGLGKRRPLMAGMMAVFMFSLAGIPPLAGFFGKFYVFIAALKAGLVMLAVVGVVSSVIAAYYYLRIVKLMYFDEEKTEITSEMAPGMKYLLMGCAAAALLFILVPAPLMKVAAEAAKALWL